MSTSTDKKKVIYRNDYNISKVNDSSTLETYRDKNDLDDSIYEQFIEQLTITKFNQFSFYCKEKEIDNVKHDMKIKKFQFFNIMKNVFPNSAEFLPLYEKIFNRFKLLKCKIIYDPLNDNYFVNSIYSNEEIDIYEISCALACFIKCFFFQKLKILFDLSDTDEDGFINEKELKKMIYTINYIFSREENSIGTESTITYLSLASIKAKKAFELIMGHPGNLSLVIQKEKYINYNNFLSAVQKIYNYKYSLIPLFISFKASLNIKRNEKELEVNTNIFNDYSRILNDVISLYKKQSDIGNSNFDFKKNLENIEIDKKRKKIMNNSSQVKTANLILNSQYYNLGTLSNSNNNSSFIGNYSQKFDSININNTQNDNSKIKSKKHQNLRYNVYYNKICGLEAYPIKLKEVEKEKEKEREKDYKIIKKIKSFKDNNKKYNSQGYMNMVEILDEIAFLINKQKKINSEGVELARDYQEIVDENNKFKEKIRDPGAIIPPSSIKPYIFDEIFQHKLKKNP